MGDRSKTYTGPNAAEKFHRDEQARDEAERKNRSPDQERAHRAARRCYETRSELIRVAPLLDGLVIESRNEERVELALASAIGVLTESGEVLDRIASAPNGNAERLRLQLQKAEEEIATLKQTIAYLEEQAQPDMHLR